MKFFKNLRNTGFGTGVMLFYLFAFVGFIHWARWVKVVVASSDFHACLYWMCFSVGGMIFGLGLIIISDLIFENARIIRKLQRIKKIKRVRERKRDNLLKPQITDLEGGS
mgnify:CR=1 FL=1